MSDTEIVLNRIKEVKTHGHGQIVVKIRDGQVQMIETTKQDKVK